VAPVSLECGCKEGATAAPPTEQVGGGDCRAGAIGLRLSGKSRGHEGSDEVDSAAIMFVSTAPDSTTYPSARTLFPRRGGVLRAVWLVCD
jgi:hypothetical protein